MAAPWIGYCSVGRSLGIFYEKQKQKRKKTHNNAKKKNNNNEETMSTSRSASKE